MKRKRNRIRYYVSIIIIILCVFTIAENKKLIDSKFDDVENILQEIKKDKEPIIEKKSKEVTEKSKDTTQKTKVEEKNTKKSKKTVGEIERYAYSYLNKEEKKVYLEWVDILHEHKTKVEVSTLDPDMIEKVYRYVLSDYPGIFWVNGYSYVEHKLFNKTTKVVVEPAYTITKEERQKKQKQIDKKVKEYLTGISKESTDYEKMKYVYDSLTTKVLYNKNAKDNQNICSVFLNGESVCQGYAYATQYLLQKLNIPCVTVTGTAMGEGHAWNLVKLDGEYYYVDTTWGSNSNQKEYANQVNYAYFCLTSAEMSLTHKPSGLFPLPECTATQNNYFVKEGYYFETFETSVINKFIQTAYENKQNSICLKFANKELYESFCKYYIEESHIFDCIGQTTSIRYLEDNVHHVLTFYRQSE